MRIGKWIPLGSFFESSTLRIAPTVPSGGTFNIEIPYAEPSREPFAIEYRTLQCSTLRSQLHVEGPTVHLTPLPEEHPYDDLFG
jgi:hypothetical protein